VAERRGLGLLSSAMGGQRRVREGEGKRKTKSSWKGRKFLWE